MEFINGYNILSMEDHNFCAIEDDLKHCTKVERSKIRKERDKLLKSTLSKLGTKDFMRLIHITEQCIYAYYPNFKTKDECESHHCAECWEKVIRELEV